MSNKQQYNRLAVEESSIAKRDADRELFKASRVSKHDRDRAARANKVVWVAVSRNWEASK
jgi:hypothetical protein